MPYTYLPQSIEAFFQGEVMQNIIRKADSSQVSFRRSNSGTLHVYSPLNKLKIITPLKKYSLIGSYALGHSFSKNFFNEKFPFGKHDAEYVNFEIPTIEEFPKNHTR